MSSRYLRFVAAAAGMLLACPIPAAVVAQTSVQEIVVHPKNVPLNAETRQKKVSYADLNLSTESGQKAIIGRIKAAGRVVCSPQPNRRTKEQQDYTNCYDGAVSGALADLGNSDVSAMYAKMK
ncbi:MAG TPA: UrcA family protein [Caulobacteraceae bacterium]|jgi:UrcA family protein